MITPAAVEFRNITKSFGRIRANDNVSFQLQAGGIHGIVGENGAGKSTAMKILFGLHQPDQGDILIRGHQITLPNPTAAMRAGIGMVHQHFMLAETVTALDNILLQKPGSAFERLDRKGQKQSLQKLAQRYGFDIDLDAEVSRLPVGTQQRIEILKILSQDSEIIILDEPTAVLTPHEIQDLFKNLRQLRAEGKTILLITHKLKEVMALTDTVTVFRSGHIIDHCATKDTSLERLAELMVGRRLNSPPQTAPRPPGREVLQVQDLTAAADSQKIHQLHFSIYAHEIVGIAGVEGNGQDLLIRSLIEPQSLKTLQGHIRISGRETLSMTTAEIRTLGVGAFPEDRLRFGALPQRPVFENFLLGQHRRPEFYRFGFLKKSVVLRATRETMQLYDIRPRNEFLNFGDLSGGNQQKLVVARELSHAPDFILTAQPTRGVDIGASEFIHEQLRQHRDRGAGLLLISSELDELMALCQRILVLYKGQLVGEFQGPDFDEVAIGLAMGGGQ